MEVNAPDEIWIYKEEGNVFLTKEEYEEDKKLVPELTGIKYIRADLVEDIKRKLRFCDLSHRVKVIIQEELEKENEKLQKMNQDLILGNGQLIVAAETLEKELNIIIDRQTEAITDYKNWWENEQEKNQKLVEENEKLKKEKNELIDGLEALVKECIDCGVMAELGVKIQVLQLLSIHRPDSAPIKE